MLDVEPTTETSGYVERPFDEAKAELESQGYQIISLEQFARLRRERGRDSHVARYGAYTREGFLYVPQKGIFLVRNSPIMQNVKEATQCHKEDREFYLTEEQIEEALEDSVQFKYCKAISTKRFGEDERTVFAFGNEAEKYGEFLDQAGIKEMPVDLRDFEKRPYVRQVFFHRLGNDFRSGIGANGFLSLNVHVRGIKFASTNEGSK
jgi:hypothetical protein